MQFFQMPSPARLFPPPSSTVLLVRDAPNVVLAVRELRRLETAEAHIERVIDLKSKQSHLFGLVQSEDAVLLVASGQVTAGIDLGELTEGSVVVDTTKMSAKVTLPKAKIFSSRLDNTRTYVHSRSTDLLARRDESLETEARKAAEQEMLKAATDTGLIDRAQESGRRTVEGLVRSLGYTSVVVE